MHHHLFYQVSGASSEFLDREAASDHVHRQRERRQVPVRAPADVLAEGGFAQAGAADPQVDQVDAEAPRGLRHVGQVEGGRHRAVRDRGAVGEHGEVGQFGGGGRAYVALDVVQSEIPRNSTTRTTRGWNGIAAARSSGIES